MRRRNIKLYFWVSESERDFIKQEVPKTNLNRDAFIRSRLLGNPIPLASHPDLSRLLRELNAIGNNVNQLARLANMGADVPRAEILAAVKAFERMEKNILEVVDVGTDKDMASKGGAVQ